MAKIALLGDTHFGARGSAQFFLDSTAVFLRDTFFPALKELGIREFIQVGDLVENRKSISMLATNALRTELLEPTEVNSLTGHYILGNHDILHNNSSKFNWQREIIHSATYPNQSVVDKPTTIKRGKIAIDLIPWINDDNYDESIAFIKNSTSDICIGHFDIIGFEMVSGVECVHGFDRKIFKHYKRVFSGHYHNFSEADNITYIGTPTQFNWSDYGSQKGFVILDTDTGDYEFIDNPINSFRKIMYDDTSTDYNDMDVDEFANCFVKVIVKEKKNDKMFSGLIERLDLIAYGVDPIDTRELAIEQGDPDLQTEDSFSILLRTVDEIETELDRNSVKTKMSYIHKEAEEQMVL